MKAHRIFIMSLLAVLSLMSGPAFAYIGPGAGLGMIGSLLAVVAAIVVALVGIIVYPIRVWKKKREQQAKGGGDESAG